MRGSNGPSLPRAASTRQRADDERRFEHRLEREQRVQRQRGRDLRAVDQRQAFLGLERERRDAGVAQHVGGRARAAPSTSNSPSPISASVMCASGARSPDAPTEPWHGT